MNSPSTTSVLFIAPSAYPLGGVQTWLDYMLTGLKNHSVQTHLALPDGKFHNSAIYLKKHTFEPVELLKNPTGSIEGRNQALKKAISDINPDVILVVNIYDVYRAVNELRAQRDLRAKVVTTIHGIHPGLINDIDQHSDVIDGVISTNRLTQKLVNEKTRIGRSRSFYAPYGVSDKETSRRRAKQFTIAYVGRFEESQKRIKDMLCILQRIVKERKDVIVLLAGDGPDLDNFFNWYEEQGKPKNIKYLGVLTANQLNQQVYAVADVLLLTSSWETGPIVAWEAIRHGVTLVTSRYIGSQEEGSLKHNENCLMFDLGDVEEAVQQLNYACNAELRAQLNKSALSLVENQYSVNSSLSCWAKCLHSISDKNPKEHSSNKRINRDSGLLTNFLYKTFGLKGLYFAERLRRVLNRSFSHSEAGSEWPHCGRNQQSDHDVRALNAYIK